MTFTGMVGGLFTTELRTSRRLWKYCKNRPQGWAAANVAGGGSRSCSIADHHPGSGFIERRDYFLGIAIFRFSGVLPGIRSQA